MSGKIHIPMADGKAFELDLKKIADDVIESEFNGSLVGEMLEAFTNALLSAVDVAVDKKLAALNASK